MKFKVGDKVKYIPVASIPILSSLLTTTGIVIDVVEYPRCSVAVKWIHFRELLHYSVDRLALVSDPNDIMKELV